MATMAQLSFNDFDIPVNGLSASRLEGRFRKVERNFVGSDVTAEEIEREDPGGIGSVRFCFEQENVLK